MVGRRSSNLVLFFLFYVGVAVFALFFLIIYWCSGCEDNSRSSVYGDYGAMRGERVLEQWRMGIIVLTAPTEWDRRSLIRDTWLSRKIPKVKHYFPIGMKNLSTKALTQIQEEDSLFQDILPLYDLKDDYSNLTRKLLLTISMMTQFGKFGFLLKTDSDSFVNLAEGDSGGLLSALDEIQHPRLYWGFFDGRANVKRKGKWAEEEWRLCDRYLPYAKGGGYVLGWDLVDFIARNAHLLQVFLSEDVSLGAWLSGLRVHYHHDPRFDTEWKSRGCSNKYLITHKQSEREMRDKWDHLKKTGLLCVEEKRLRASYIYNWDEFPSRCCVRTNNSHVP